MSFIKMFFDDTALCNCTLYTCEITINIITYLIIWSINIVWLDVTLHTLCSFVLFGAIAIGSWCDLC